MKIWLKTALPSGNILRSTLWTPPPPQDKILRYSRFSNNHLWQPRRLWRPIFGDFDMNLHLCCAWLRSETRLSQKNWLTWGLSVFYSKGHPGWDRCPQWHLQECGWEQVEDGQGSGQLRGSGVPPAQTGWHESTLERPEGQISQHQVRTPFSQYLEICFAFCRCL